MKSVTKPFENEYRAVFSVIKYSAKRNLNYTTSHRKLLLLPSKKRVVIVEIYIDTS